MRTRLFRRTLCLMLALMMMAASLTSCSGKDPAAITSETTEETTASVPRELLEVEEQIKKLDNVQGNIWFNEDEKYQSLIKLVRSQIKGNENIKGSIIIATDDDVLIASGTNMLDRDGNEVSPYTVYEIGSCTKSMTALCILKLVEEGKLSLTDTLGGLFPEYSSCAYYEEVKGVTVSNLLHMRSGIRDYLNDPLGFWGDEIGSILHGDTGATAASSKAFFEKIKGKIVEQVFSRKPGCEKDTKYEYSNTNYVLLAEIIEKKTGKTYKEFIEETVFKPCNMTSTSSMSSGDVQASLPKGGWYLNNDEAKGDGDVHSSVVDMLKYDRAVFGGYLLKEESMKELLKPIDGYACGWEVQGSTVNHAGSTAGFYTFNFIFEYNGKKLYVIMCAHSGDYTMPQVIIPLLKF